MQSTPAINRFSYVSHEAIDKARWDNAMMGFPSGSLFATAAFLDVLCPGWCAILDEEYQVLLPLPVRKKWGMDYIFQPFFIQSLGLFSSEPLPEKMMIEAFKTIPTRFKIVDIALNTFNKYTPVGFKSKRNQTYVLGLSPSLDIIEVGFSNNCKRNVRKAAKHAVEIHDNPDLQQIIDLFVGNKGKKAVHFKEADYGILTQLINLTPQDCRRSFGAYDAQGHLLAGVVFIRSFQQWHFFFSGANQQARELGAMPALIYHFIQSAAGTNAVLNFNGSNDPSLANFYGGFGAIATTYKTIRRNGLPFVLKWLKG